MAKTEEVMTTESKDGKIILKRGVFFFPANAAMMKTGRGRKIPHIERLVYGKSVTVEQARE